MLLDPVLSHVWLSDWPWSEKGWLRIRELYIVVLRLSSKAMERQLCVRSWMDVLIPFVHVTESAHYCYLQKYASTKQVFRISWKKFPPFDCKVFEAARAEGMHFRSTERFIDQFFLRMELCGSNPPPHLSAQWTAPQVPPLYLSAPWRAPLPGFCPSVSGGGWRPFYVAGSSNSLKALVQIKYATLRPSQPGIMINPTAPTALLMCLSLSLKLSVNGRRHVWAERAGGGSRVGSLL